MEDAGSILLEGLTKFYCENPQVWRNFKGLVTKEKGYELTFRTIDWLVTNHAKKFQISFSHSVTRRVVEIYTEYRTMLKAYQKLWFDPYARGDTIQFSPMDGEETVSTSVRQLNFYRWAIPAEVIKYCREHESAIEIDRKISVATHSKKRAEDRSMIVTIGAEKKRFKRKVKRKRLSAVSKNQIIMNKESYQIFL